MFSIPELGKKFEVTIVDVFDLGLIVESNKGDTYQLRVPELTDRFQVLDRESRLKEVIGETISVYEFVETKRARKPAIRVRTKTQSGYT
ncbi:hypothetical protein [Pseudoalteromonas luteoviolacea]|uniref:hypothetical protein n=1 Tax=Pseudoalteromonas luteoviolacea TaxID=43657 RepID=UPI000AF97C08|nr:hypothetical protein [Pseudoalteromonas luteoviolacea]